jgi:predicted DNA-binding transcriptional regulator YafY
MDKHYGKIVEYIVRKNGFSITQLAEELFVNRRSIYNWFNQETLRSDIVYRIGCVIRHDFSKEFPELFNSDEFEIIHQIRKPYTPNNDQEDWKTKYLNLLEKYNLTLIKKGINKKQTVSL